MNLAAMELLGGRARPANTGLGWEIGGEDVATKAGRLSKPKTPALAQR